MKSTISPLLQRRIQSASDSDLLATLDLHAGRLVNGNLSVEEQEHSLLVNHIVAQELVSRDLQSQPIHIDPSLFTGVKS